MATIICTCMCPPYAIYNLVPINKCFYIPHSLKMDELWTPNLNYVSRSFKKIGCVAYNGTMYMIFSVTYYLKLYNAISFYY